MISFMLLTFIFDSIAMATARATPVSVPSDSSYGPSLSIFLSVMAVLTPVSSLRSYTMVYQSVLPLNPSLPQDLQMMYSLKKKMASFCVPLHLSEAIGDHVEIWDNDVDRSYAVTQCQVNHPRWKGNNHSCDCSQTQNCLRQDHSLFRSHVDNVGVRILGLLCFQLPHLEGTVTYLK